MNDGIRRRFDRLEAIRLRIEGKVGGADAALVVRQPGLGRWSAAQVISHLVRAESLSVSYIAKKASDPSKLRAAGLVEACKSILVIAVMRVPIRFRAPEIVAEVPDNEAPAELRERWAKTREEMRKLLDAIPDSQLSMCLYKHPVAGPMTLASALDFMIAHATRHEKQIERGLLEAGE